MCDYINSRQILLENMQILAEAPVTTRVTYFEFAKMISPGMTWVFISCCIA